MKKPARSLVLSRTSVATFFVVAFALVAGAAALWAVSMREIREANDEAARAQRALVALGQFFTTLNEAETSQRGFVLTRDTRYLVPYEAARARFGAETAAVAGFFADEPANLGRVQRLEALARSRFQDIERTIRLRRERGIAPALNVIETDEGWRLMTEIRDIVQSLQRHEVARANQFTAAAARRAEAFQNLNHGLLILASGLVATAAGFLVSRLRDIEGLIKVCAWTRRVYSDGRWISFEEYLASRFNLQCTHGISDDAATKLAEDIKNTPVPPEACEVR